MATATSYGNQIELPGIPAATGISLFRSWQQALEERLIVPVSPELAKQAGFRVPVALSSAAWEECVEWAEAEAQEATWSILLAAHCAIRAKTERGATARFSLSRLAFGDAEASTVPLIAIVGPGDDKAPALTIYLDAEI